MRAALLLFLLGCRASRDEQGPVVYDALGLPDCAATWDGVGVCDAIKPWTSSWPDGFWEGRDIPIRWIGAEVDPSYCATSSAEAEAWALAYEPDAEGASHRLDLADARWFDLYRFDAEGVAYERQRILHCDFLELLAPAPPGVESVDSYAAYATVPATEEDDFFPVFREMLRWRTTQLPVQVILAYGEVQTESMHLGACVVRCGDCEDGSGGRFRDITGVLERIDLELDPRTGIVRYGVDPVLEAECYASW